jgi:glucuronate isomerase
MKKFLDEHFLLQTKAAQQLYHDYAREMPIIDYHCHLPAQQIASDHRFEISPRHGDWPFFCQLFR